MLLRIYTKQKFLKLLLLAFLGISSSYIHFANSASNLKGHEVGNGGLGVLNNGSVKTLDLVEKQYFYIKETEAYKEGLKPLLQILDRAYYVYHLKYHKNRSHYTYLPQLLKESLDKMQWYFTDKQLPFTNDAGPVLHPVNRCKSLKEKQANDCLVQMAIQYKNTVIINKKYFTESSRKDQVALFLHELLLNVKSSYNKKIVKDIGTSDIRNLVSLYMSSFILKEDPIRIVKTTSDIYPVALVTSKKFSFNWDSEWDEIVKQLAEETAESFMPTKGLTTFSSSCDSSFSKQTILKKINKLSSSLFDYTTPSSEGLARIFKYFPMEFVSDAFVCDVYRKYLINVVSHHTAKNYGYINSVNKSKVLNKTLIIEAMKVVEEILEEIDFYHKYPSKYFSPSFFKTKKEFINTAFEFYPKYFDKKIITFVNLIDK